MALIRDVTSHSCRGSCIFLQRAHWTSPNHVFLECGRDSLHTCTASGPFAPRESPCMLLKTLLPCLETILNRLASSITGLKVFKHSEFSPCRDRAQLEFHTVLLAKMASDSSSSSGITAEERIGALEAALGRLRAKHEDQNAKLEALSKAGGQSWDLLNKELMQLRADFSDQMEDLKDETRTGFKDTANLHGNFGHRIAALEAEVTKLKAKLEK